MFDLSGKVAVVTGGARNLGYDAATVLAAAGCDVVITSRDLQRAEQAAESIRRAHAVSVLPLELDQTDFDTSPPWLPVRRPGRTGSTSS